MSELDANARAIVSKVIVASPYGKLLGLVLESCEPDRVAVRLPYRTDVTTLGDTRRRTRHHHRLFALLPLRRPRRRPRRRRPRAPAWP
jgi:hypothetical protein